MRKSILIKSESDRPSHWDGELFCYRSELAEVDEDDIFEVLRGLYGHRSDISSPVPLYRILWTHLAVNSPRMGSLLSLIPLSRRLGNHIQDNDIRILVIGKNVPSQYVAMAQDVCDDCGCEIRHQDGFSLHQQLMKKLKGIWETLRDPTLLIMDQLLSLLIPTSKIGDKSVTIFPYPGRFDSTLPIAEVLKEDVDCLISQLGASLFRSPPDVNYNLDLNSYQNHSSVGIIFKEILTIINIHRPSLRRNLNNELTEFFESEFGVSLPNTIQAVTRIVIEQNLRSILYFHWADDFFGENDTSAIVVGGLSPRELAIIEASHKHGIKSYYIPHTVTTGTEFLPPRETTQFVASDLGKRQIKTIYAELEKPTLIATGRPYFEERFDQLGPDNEKSDPNEDLTVMVATQSYENDIRYQFIDDVCTVFNQSALISELVVKTHPSENNSYYEKILDNNNFENISTSMSNSSLESEIANSDLVITINSNVGLEAMLNGTPAVCYNKWHPLIQHKPYSRSSEVPLIENVDDLAQFVQEQTIITIHDLGDIQYAFAKSQYLDNKGVSKMIANRISDQNIPN